MHITYRKISKRCEQIIQRKQEKKRLIKKPERISNLMNKKFKLRVVFFFFFFCLSDWQQTKRLILSSVDRDRIKQTLS